MLKRRAPGAVPPLSLNGLRPLRFLLFNLLTFMSAALALAVLVEWFRQLNPAQLEDPSLPRAIPPREGARCARNAAPTLF